MKQNVARILALALIACAPVAAPSLAISSLDPEVGLLWIGNYDARATAGLAPSPLVLMAGISVPFAMASPDSPWLIAIGLDVYRTYYEYDITLGRALPTEDIAGAGFSTWGVILGPRFGLLLPLGRRLRVGAELGLDLVARFPVELSNSDPASVAGRLPALEYFFRKGRFFYPETGLLLVWKAADAVSLEFGARVLWPIFHLWDGLGLPFADEMIATGTAGVRIALR